MSVTDKINVVAGLYVAFAFEALTVASAIKTLTESVYRNSDGNYAKRALITCETAQIRYKYNGDDPTSSEGHLLNPMDTLVIIGATNIKNFKAIRTGTTSGKIQVTYEK